MEQIKSTISQLLTVVMLCLLSGPMLAQTFTITPDEVCLGEPFTLSFSDIGNTSCMGMSFSYIWEREDDMGNWFEKTTTTDDPMFMEPTASGGDNGNWRVRIRDMNGDTCFMSPEVNLSVGFDPHTVSIDGPSTVNICEGESLPVMSDPGGGATNGVTWSDNVPGGGFSNPSSTNTSYTPPMGFSGTIIITVTTNASGGCPVAQDMLTVNVNPEAMVNILTAPTSICQGESIPLMGTFAGSAQSITWSDNIPGGFFSNVNSLNPTFTPPSSFSGMIIITLETDNPSGSCTAAADQMILTVDQQPTITPEADPMTICQGESFDLSFENNNDAVNSLTWQASVLGIFDPNNTANEPSFSPIASHVGAITFTLTTNANGACNAAMETVDVMVDPSPTVAITCPDPDPLPEICQGQSITLCSEISGSASGVVWTASVSGGNFAPNANASSPTYFPPPNHTGQVTLTVMTNTSSGACDPDQATITIIVKPGTVAVAELLSASPICDGGSFQLNGSIAGGANLESWQADDAGTFSNPNSLGTTFTPGAGFSGTISVSFTTTDGPCGDATSNSIDLTVNQAANVSVAVDAAGKCEGNTFELDGSFSGSVITGVWTSNVSGDDFSPNASSADVTYTPPAGFSGPIVLTLTSENPSGPCPSVSETLNIDVFPTPTATVQVDEFSGSFPGDGRICLGDQVGLEVVGSTTSSTCVWTNTGGLTNPDDCTWNIDDLAATTMFNLLISNSFGCTATSNKTIVVSPDPMLDLVIESPCVGETFELSATTGVPTNIMTYRWEKDGAFVGNGASYSVANATTNDSGTYALEATDSEGCVWTISQNVPIDPIPIPVLETTFNSVCQNGQVFYKVESISPNSNFIWSISPAVAETDTTIVDGILFVHWTTPGDYIVRVTEFFGSNANTVCKGTAELNVSVSSETAPDVAPILHYELNDLLIVKDPDVSCYLWGYYDPLTREMVTISDETNQAFAATGDALHAFDPNRVYWCQTWNGDCGTPSCSTVSFRAETTEPGIVPDEERFVLYPNPNNGNFQLEINRLPKENYDLMIVDLLGRVVERRNVATNDGVLNESFLLHQFLSNGLYTLVLYDDIDIYKTVKFVVFQ